MRDAPAGEGGVAQRVGVGKLRDAGRERLAHPRSAGGRRGVPGGDVPRSRSGGATCRISRVVSPWITQAAVVYSVLGLVVVLGLGNAARRLARAVRSPSSDDASERLAALTNREREILKLFAQGLSYQEIGEIRSNSALTVRNAVSAVQRKLGFRTRQQMVLWAVRAGLVDGGLS